MSLWIPVYESDKETIKSVISTYFQMFPNGIIFSKDLDGKGFDAVLLGPVEPTRIDLDKTCNGIQDQDCFAIKGKGDFFSSLLG
jgi:hypothetical protein